LIQNFIARMKLLSVYLITVALMLVRRVASAFGAAEGSLLQLHEEPENGQMPKCSFHHQPMPKTLGTALPQLVDVFAEQNAQRVYFIGLNQKVCLASPVGGNSGADATFTHKIYECSFSASVSGRVLGSTKSDQIASDNDAIVFHCNIPLELRKLAINDVDRAKLVVNVRQLQPARPAELADTWNNLPVCSNPVVNNNQVLMKPSKKHFLSACLVSGYPVP
jgi:hypothetical protein